MMSQAVIGLAASLESRAGKNSSCVYCPGQANGFKPIGKVEKGMPHTDSTLNFNRL